MTWFQRWKCQGCNVDRSIWLILISIKRLCHGVGKVEKFTRCYEEERRRGDFIGNFDDFVEY